jgi:hypothetical protein
LEQSYRCPGKGAGGCGGLSRAAGPIDAHITALVIADHQRIASTMVEQLPPWPRDQELREYLARIETSTREYEAGRYAAEQYFPSLARMEASVAALRREQRQHAVRQDARRAVVEDLGREWTRPGFSMEQKQAAIAQTLTAVVIAPAGKGVRFHTDQITPIYQEER